MNLLRLDICLFGCWPGKLFRLEKADRTIREWLSIFYAHICLGLVDQVSVLRPQTMAHILLNFKLDSYRFNVDLD